MDNGFLEYLIPQIHNQQTPKYVHFFERRINRICREEGFYCRQVDINDSLGPGVFLKIESKTEKFSFGICYAIRYSVINDASQIISTQYLRNNKPAAALPKRHKARVDALDARIRRLFPSHPRMVG